MTCVICKHGETAPGTVTVTLQRGRSTIIIKVVPAMVCENCGEYYLSEEVTRRIMSQAEAAVARGIELEMMAYAALSDGCIKKQISADSLRATDHGDLTKKAAGE